MLENHSALWLFDFLLNLSTLLYFFTYFFTNSGHVHSAKNETDLNKSTQLRDAFIGHSPHRHDYGLRIGCTETGTFRGRSVLNSGIPMRLFALKFANSSSVIAKFH